MHAERRLRREARHGVDGDIDDIDAGGDPAGEEREEEEEEERTQGGAMGAVSNSKVAKMLAAGEGVAAANRVRPLRCGPRQLAPLQTRGGS